MGPRFLGRLGELRSLTLIEKGQDGTIVIFLAALFCAFGTLHLAPAGIVSFCLKLTKTNDSE